MTKMHSLKRQALGTLLSLTEQAATVRADIWCERNRIMTSPIEGAWNFKYHPWLRDMINSDATENVGQKSAQMGYTEVALNRSLFTLAQKKRDVLYVLPAQTPDASDFSSARFDPAIELSPKLQAIFVKINNVGLKRAGTNSLYVRGSRSTNVLKSIPVSLIVLDEVEEMTPKAIALARERASGQFDFQLWAISTPRIPNRGINALFLRSDESHFFFKCPHCSRSTELVYPDCLVVTAERETDPGIKGSHLICKECKHKLDNSAKHVFLHSGPGWVPSHENRDVRGFYINQLYSSMPACSPVEIAKCVLRSQESPADEQELYNSKVGIPHIVDGANVSEGHIEACIRDYKMPSAHLLQKIMTFGVDVGTHCNVVFKSWDILQDITIADINAIAIPSVFFAAKFKNYSELHEMIRKFKPDFGVIDNLPDTRASLEFARTYPGMVKLCSFSTTGNREISGLESERITVNRTTWLDQSLGRYLKGNINLPSNIPDEFKRHITAPVRIYLEHKKTGEQTAIYLKKGPDHYAFADCYAEIALKVFYSQGSVIQGGSERTN